MRNYYKNKDFISQNFLKNIKKKKEKINNNSIIYLLLLNIFIFPRTVEIMSKLNDTETNEIQEKHRYISNDSILRWIYEIDDNIYSLRINNGEGEIEVLNKKKIYSMEEKDIFSISTMKKSEDDRYSISISKEDIYE